ncbi:MAG: hypothetical protein KDB69_06540, partial [Acidimicrobiia bacterium]|nr:hypothetical protein [Acidimicrobiia bacterium]
STETIRIQGAYPGEPAFTNLSDLTLTFDLEYINTRLNRPEQALVVEARARNNTGRTVKGPLIMVIERFTEPTVNAPFPDGFTPVGKPFFTFLDTDEDLPSGESSALKTLIFRNPENRPVDFDVTWLGDPNGAPFFTSIPVSSADSGSAYRYPSMAVSPRDYPLTYELRQAPFGMTVDPATGFVEWIPTVDDEGTHSVVIRAFDSLGGVAEQRYTIDVQSIPNRSPAFTSVPVTSVPDGGAYEYDAMASDPDRDPLMFSKLVGPSGLEVDSEGAVRWAVAESGDHAVRIRVADGRGGSSEQAFLLSVGSSATNPHSPRLFGSPATVAGVDRLYSYLPVASDADGDPLTFSLLNSPAGMAVDPVTGRVTWVPNATQLGAHGATLIVSDGRGGEASQSWAIEVLTIVNVQAFLNRAPSFTSTPVTRVSTGARYEYDAMAVDPDDDALTFSKLAGPAGLVVSVDGMASWDAAVVGSYPTRIRVEDGRGGFSEQAFVLTVGSIATNPTTPSLVGIPATTASVSRLYLYSPIANDVDGDPLTFSLPQGPTGMAVDPTTGRVTWVPFAAQVGAHDVTLVVSDGRGGEAWQSWAIEVLAQVPNRAPGFESTPSFVAAVGSTYEYLASAVDPEGEDLDYSLFEG